MNCNCREHGRTLRRTGHAAGWTLPSVALLLVPKCPMCVAAWRAVAGVSGVSFTAASWLRTTVLWLCWGLLAVMAVRLVMVLRRRAAER